MDTNEKEIEINRKENLYLTTLNLQQHQRVRCAICNKPHKVGDVVVRINVHGYKYNRLSICLDCLHYIKKNEF